MPSLRPSLKPHAFDTAAAKCCHVAESPPSEPPSAAACPLQNCDSLSGRDFGDDMAYWSEQKSEGKNAMTTSSWSLLQINIDL